MPSSASTAEPHKVLPSHIQLLQTLAITWDLSDHPSLEHLAKLLQAGLLQVNLLQVNLTYRRGKARFHGRQRA